jgi:hypothetical protein
MKKILLLGIFCLILVFSFGQSIQLRKTTGELISNDDAIHVYADTSAATIYAHLYVKNISSSNLNVKLKYYIITQVSGTEQTYCWGSCYTPPGPNPSIAVPVTKGDSAMFDGDYKQANHIDNLITYCHKGHLRIENQLRAGSS